jgi:hypothetical protein
MPTSYRQEVFNVLLAQLLQERGVITAPESVIKGSIKQNRMMPDVIISYNGLRTAIEGEVNDQPNPHQKSLESVFKRVVDGIAHIGVAVVYPKSLRNLDFNNLKSELALCTMDIAIVTESEKTEFVKGDVDNLESILRHTYDQLVKEDVVAEAVAALDAGIDKFAGAIVTKSGVIDRVAQTLGIKELPRKDSKLQSDSE